MEPIALFDRDTVDRLDWPPDAEATRRFFLDFVKHGPRPYAANIDADCYFLQAADVVLPVVVTDGRGGNSWVCSQTGYYIGTLGHYVGQMDPGMRRQAFHTLQKGAGSVCGWIDIDRSVFINNWLVSTSPIPPRLDARIDEITAFLCGRFPDHYIVLKSINGIEHNTLMARLREIGFRILPFRSIYFYRPSEQAKRNRHMRKDTGLLGRTAYRQLDTRERYDYTRVADLFRRIYLQKYAFTGHPEFCADYFERLHQSGAITLWGFAKNGRLDAFLAAIEPPSGSLQVPYMGYDPTVPRQEGLYRMCATAVLRYALERGRSINLSSGVGDFKVFRGAVPTVEYVAIYGEHLRHRRRAALKMLSWLSRQVLLPEID